MKAQETETAVRPQKFSVLMSLYIKEKPEYFVQCMQSLLVQTVPADEIVIVEDGPLTRELESVLQGYVDKYPGLIRTVPMSENRGLGLALAAGVPACSYELIARMDTDDIARPDRFEKQLAEYERDSTLDICGSHIKEFTGSVDNAVSVRKVPLTHGQIIRYQKKRCAFNHMTVMLKKSAVLVAGNYQHAPLMEDDYLWVRMIQTGAKCKNLDECLVYVRAGEAMMNRRGGLDYAKKYYRGRKLLYDTGFLSLWDLWSTAVVQFFLAIAPVRLRAFIYKKFLRS